MINTDRRGHFFQISGEHVWTAKTPLGRYVAWFQDEDQECRGYALRGYGATRMAAIADLSHEREGVLGD